MTRAKKPGVVVRKFDSREAWLNARLGTIGGSSAKDIGLLRNGTPKAGEFRIIAESIIGSLAIAEDELTSSQVMERGQRLEPEAVKYYEKVTGNKAVRALVMWAREDDQRITVSPDAWVGTKGATEGKCPLAPKHVEALYCGGIPASSAGYFEQVLQYFVVNEKLQWVDWFSYHPDFPPELRIVIKRYTRKELKEDIAAQLEEMRQSTARIRGIVNKLTLYSPEAQKMQEVQSELVDDAGTVELSPEDALDRVYQGVKSRS